STVLNASGATTYSWSPANGLSSTTAANPSASPATTTTYTVTGTSGTCTGTATVQVTVNPIPIVSASTSASPICVGSTIDLTATGATSYSWSPSASTTNPFTTSPATTTTYTVTGTSAGCTGTASVQVVVVNTLVVTVTAVPTQICIGSPTFLTAAGATTYSWNPSGSSTNPIELNPTTTSTYTVTGTSAGCTGTASVTVTVNPLPTVSFSADTNMGCSPLCVKFRNLSTPTSSSTDWFFGDGNSANTITSANNCYHNAGTYSVKLTVTDSLGCQNSETINNMITVFQSPVADFSMAPQPAIIIDPTVYFTDHSTGGVSQWEWNFGDVTNAGSTLQNPSYAYSDTGYYNVQLIVTTNHGCIDSISKVVYVEGDFVLYVPNAFTPNGDGLNDVFQPKGSDIDPNNYNLTIFDRWGNLIFHTTNFSQGWDGRANNGKSVAQEDVYVWRISVKDFKGASHLYIGHVSLVR
ncbi:MAG TPA: PKD domain-containing protein, partial [Bacteroidia bacterium]|nr:PKD domain-containing protein [Bacteroidia bacterium]